MTIQFTVYDAAGNILRTGNTMTVAQAQLQASEPGTYVTTIGTDPDTQVINPDTGAAVPRGLMNVNGVQTSANKTTVSANGIDKVTISPVPHGTTYQITVPAGLGIEEVPENAVNDGTLQITTTVAGNYSVRLRSGNYLDFKVNFNAS